MKEVEFKLSSNDKDWMDTSVISDIPFKVTIIDPSPYVNCVVEALDQLPCMAEGKYTVPAIKTLARQIVHTAMYGIIQRRRAWVHGYDVDFHLHLMNLRKLIGFDMAAELREKLRDDLNSGDNRWSSNLLDGVLKELVALLELHMNPNKFVVHDLKYTLDMRTLMLEEYADWRVIEWTKNEQAKIDDRHADV